MTFPKAIVAIHSFFLNSLSETIYVYLFLGIAMAGCWILSKIGECSECTLLNSPYLSQAYLDTILTQIT